MDSCGVFYFLLLFIWMSFDVHAQSNNFIVTNFGAIGDGKTDNSQAFLKAWARACGTPGGVVKVPKGKFHVKGVKFQGPCNGRTMFLVDGVVVASDEPMLTEDFWISFYKVVGLSLVGNGLFDGNGANSWAHCQGFKKCNGPPTSLKIIQVTDASIENLSFLNSKTFHLTIHESANVKVNNLRIDAPAESPNTDGIHIGNSRNVIITNSRIATGDDCVSLGDGATNINVTGVLCGPGHGISIGSLGKYRGEEDVTRITVRNCTFDRTDNGLRIKTWAPSLSTTVVSDVTFAEINMINGVKNPIVIDQYYCPNKKCSGGGESTVQIKGVKYIDVRGSSATETSVDVQCSKSRPCQDIEFIGLDLTYNGKPTNAACFNAHDVFEGAQIPTRCTASLPKRKL